MRKNTPTCAQVLGLLTVLLLHPQPSGAVPAPPTTYPPLLIDSLTTQPINGMALSPRGQIGVTNGSNGNIHFYDQPLINRSSPSSTLETGLSSVSGIAFKPWHLGGGFAVSGKKAQSNPNRQAAAPEGAVQLFDHNRESIGFITDGVKNPDRLAYTPSGKLWVQNRNETSGWTPGLDDTVTRYCSEDGAHVQKSISVPSSTDVDTDLEAVFTASSTTGIFRYPLPIIQPIPVPVPITGFLSSIPAHAIAVHPDGTVWRVRQTGATQLGIYVHSADGKERTEILGLPNGIDPEKTEQIVIDGTGALLFTRDSDNIIHTLFTPELWIKDGHVTLSHLELEGRNLTLTRGRCLTVTGPLTAANPSHVTLDGGFLSAASTHITDNGELNILRWPAPRLGPVTMARGGRLESAVPLTLPSLNGNGTVVMGAQLTLQGGEFEGAIQDLNGTRAAADPGSLRVDGDVTLMGDNEYSGITKIKSGTLTTKASSLPGDVRFTGPNTTLVFDQPAITNETFAPTITEKGRGVQNTTVKKTGLGRLTLTGENTYDNLTVSQGKLIGTTESFPRDQNGVITIDGRLVFDQNMNGTSSAQLAGAGRLVKKGLGTVTLDGEMDAFSGKFRVRAGELVLSPPATMARLATPALAPNPYPDLTVENGATATIVSDMTINHLNAVGGLQIEEDATLTMTGCGFSCNTGISGPGGLTFDAGNPNEVFTISADNSYEGPTTVQSGKFVAQPTSTFGPSPLIVNQGGTFVSRGEQELSALYGDGAVKMKGPLTVAGGEFSGVISSRPVLFTNPVGPFLLPSLTVTGDFILSGNNTYTAPTFVNDGTFQLIGSLPATNTVTVTNQGIFLLSANQTLAQVDGDGEVQLEADKILTIANQGALQRVAGPVYSGTMTGDGGLTLESGLFNMAGENIYSGPTVIEGGTLWVSGGRFSPNSPLTVDEQGTFQVTSTTKQKIKSLESQGDVSIDTNSIVSVASGNQYGQFLGDGKFQVKGTKFTIHNDQGDYTGRTKVKDGILEINADFYSPISIQPAGILQGTGTLNGIIRNKGGTLRAGSENTPGTLTIAEYTGEAGSDLEALLLTTSPQKVSKIITREGMTLGNTNLKLTVLDQIFALANLPLGIEGEYPIIEGEIVGVALNNGQITGGFAGSNLDSNIRLLFGAAPTLKYNFDENGVSIGASLVFAGGRGPFVPDFSLTNNPDLQDIIAYLRSIYPNAQGNLRAAILEWSLLPVLRQDEILRSLAGDTLGTFKESVGLLSFINGLVQARGNFLRTGGRQFAAPTAFAQASFHNAVPFSLAVQSLNQDTNLANKGPVMHWDAETPTYVPFSKGRGGLWAQGFALNHRQKTMREISGFNGSSEGFLVGFDRDFTSRVFGGVALGYGGNQVNYKRNSGEAKTNSFLATTYFVYGHEDYYMDGALSFTSSSVRNKRNIPSVGVIIPANGLVATSKSSDFEVSPHLGAGMNFYLDKVTKNASLQPFLALDFNYLKEGSYSETGAGPLNLTVKSHSSRQLRTEFGFNMQKTFDFSSGEISPFIKLSYVNKAPLGSTPVVQGFQGQPMTLTTETLALNQHIFSPGVGFYMKMKNNWEMNLRYDGEFSNPSQSHALSLKATWNFPTAKNKKTTQNVALNKPL